MEAKRLLRFEPLRRQLCGVLLPALAYSIIDMFDTLSAATCSRSIAAVAAFRRSFGRGRMLWVE